MTPGEVARLLEHVSKRWPHAQLDTDAGDVWLEDLADVPAEEAQAAVRRWARAGERFPPPSGWVRSDVERAAQAPAPSFDDLQATLSRLLPRCSPYSPTMTYTVADTAETVARLAEAGAHEAVLRFVAAHGVQAVKRMPDPTWQPLDRNQQADRRDMARDYRDRVLTAWAADPRPGLALEQARRSAGLLESGSEPAGLRRTNAAALLPGKGD